MALRSLSVFIRFKNLWPYLFGSCLASWGVPRRSWNPSRQSRGFDPPVAIRRRDIKAYRVWCSLQVLSIWVEVQEPQGCQRFGVGTWMLCTSVSKTHGPRHHLLSLGLDSRLRIYTPCPLSMGMWFVHSLIFCCSCYYRCFFVCPSFG